MNTRCYRVKVPEGRRLTGFTVDGQQVPILPGEYHVHRWTAKTLSPGGGALRFVGADGRGGDVHIRLPDGADITQWLAVEVKPVDDA